MADTHSARGGMSIREWLSLIGLAFSAFMLNTSEFMPIGLLVDISNDFQISTAQAGIMVSIYALAVMLLSTPLMIAASRFPFKGLLLAVIALFGIGQAASAVAPSFPLLILARLLVAAAHALFWSIASPMAVKSVGYKHSALALSLISAGSAIAIVCGLPIGRAVGLVLGWRMTFAGVALTAFVILIFLWVVLPHIPAGKRFSLTELPTLLRNKFLLGIYVVTVVLAGSHFVAYSYIEPFLQQIAGLSDNAITMILVVYGVAGIGGSVLFSRFYGSLRRAFLRGAILGIVTAMGVLLLASGSLVSLIVVCCVWGMSYTAFSVAFQAEVLKYAPANASAVAMSLFSGLFNLGISSGTQIGGMVVDAGLMSSIGLVGAGLALFAFVLCTVLLLGPMKREDAH